MGTCTNTAVCAVTCLTLIYNNNNAMYMCFLLRILGHNEGNTLHTKLQTHTLIHRKHSRVLFVVYIELLCKACDECWEFWHLTETIF